MKERVVSFQSFPSSYRHTGCSWFQTQLFVEPHWYTWYDTDTDVRWFQITITIQPTRDGHTRRISPRGALILEVNVEQPAGSFGHKVAHGFPPEQTKKKKDRREKRTVSREERCEPINSVRTIGGAPWMFRCCAGQGNYNK